MAHRDLTNHRALVTGASGGIGRAIAVELARSDVDLVLLARRQERLEALAADVAALGRRAIPVVGDVTDAAVRRVALDAAQEQLGGLDILVNNAGVSAYGNFTDADPQRLRTIMEVNFFAAAELIREAVPLLKQGQQPVVVNVGSILGKRATPRNSEYCTSKFALHGLSESVRSELAPLGIDVLVVAPGRTKTELNDHLLEEPDRLPWTKIPGTSAGAVARATVRAICRGRREIVPSWSGWLLVTMNRVCPRLVDRFVARYG